jgi:hypothetical protein
MHVLLVFNVVQVISGGHACSCSGRGWLRKTRVQLTAWHRDAWPSGKQATPVPRFVTRIDDYRISTSDLVSLPLVHAESSTNSRGHCSSTKRDGKWISLHTLRTGLDQASNPSFCARLYLTRPSNVYQLVFFCVFGLGSACARLLGWLPLLNGVG